MKRILMFFLCTVMLLTPVLGASAEEVSEMRTYTHPTYGFSFEYPAELVLLSEETLPEISAAIDAGTLDWDEDAVCDLIAEMGENVALITPDTETHMVVSRVDMEMEVTDIDVLLYICPGGEDDMKQMYPDCEVLEPGTFYDAGFRQMTIQSFKYEGCIQHCVYDAAGTVIYYFEIAMPDTMSESDQESMMEMMNSVLASMRYPTDVSLGW